MSGLKENTKKNADSVDETRKKLAAAAPTDWNDIHERIPNITVPKEIWLQPWCEWCESEYLDGDGDRFWSEVNHGDCKTCGNTPTHYVLAKPERKKK